MLKKIISLLSLILLFSFHQPDKIRVFLIGDSTMANKWEADFPETGWGMPFAKLFNEATEVQNHAYNGRSTKSFRKEGRWKKVYDQIRPGDYVLIQFGHNDSKKSDPNRYAEANTDYRTNITRYIAETRDKGGIPILLTPVQRRKFDENGHFVDQHGDYPRVVREVAKKEEVFLIDVEKLSRENLEKIGPERSKKIHLIYPENIFPKYHKGVEDNTHFSVYGAGLVANMVANEIFHSSEHLKSFLKKSDYSGRYDFQIPLISKPYFKKDTFNIVRYGAISSIQTKSTKAIQQAIDICHAQGGGVVLLPKGFWYSGPIEMKSNVNLHLVEGATLQFSENPADYPLVETSWEGVEAIRVQSPISGKNLSRIAITGKGVIDGAGENWRPVKKSKMTEGDWNQLILSGGVLTDDKNTWYPTERALLGSTKNRPGVRSEGWSLNNTEAIKEFLRPNMIVFTECDEILLEGITFQNSPAWCIHPFMSRHIRMEDVTIRNPWYAQNGDGVDFESCENILVSNCRIDVGDDGICLKSGRDEEGRKRGRPTAHALIENSIVFHGHGGVVVGSEMSGGVNDIYVNNCQFLGTDVGLRFKTTRGRGGIVENIFIRDINMKNIAGQGIILDMYYQGKDPVGTHGNGESKPVIAKEPVNDGTPQFRDIQMENIRILNAETGVMVRGLPEMPIRNISIKNIEIQAKQEEYILYGENISIQKP